MYVYTMGTSRHEPDNVYIQSRDWYQSKQNNINRLVYLVAFVINLAATNLANAIGYNIIIIIIITI